MKTLTEAAQKELRRPFSPAAVKFKIQSVAKNQPRAQAAFYIDARLVVERLNHVVGAEAWEDDYIVLFQTSPGAHRDFYFPVECRLSVCGVVRVDVGVYQKNTSDSLSLKSAYSDAFKRAGVKFGIGSSLYACPKLWEDIDLYENGKAKGFTKGAEKRLRAAYEMFLESPRTVELFGHALDHGDVLDPEGEEAGGVPDEPTPAAGGAGSGPHRPPSQPSTWESDPQVQIILDTLKGIEDVANGHISDHQRAKLRVKVGELVSLSGNRLEPLVQWWDSLGTEGQKTLAVSTGTAAYEELRSRCNDIKAANPELPVAS